MSSTEAMMLRNIDNAIVAVQSEWNGWRTAMVHVAHLENIYWAQPSGAPRPLIHAVVRCDRLQSGQIAHHCELTRPPHRLVVCVLKSHTQSEVFAELSRRCSTADVRAGNRESRLTTPSRSSPPAHSI